MNGVPKPLLVTSLGRAEAVSDLGPQCAQFDMPLCSGEGPAKRDGFGWAIPGPAAQGNSGSPGRKIRIFIPWEVRKINLISMPTADEIDEARTANGGWTKDQLAEWGVSWPPPPGWKARLVEESKDLER